jgi:ATP-dependent Lon protease
MEEKLREYFEEMVVYKDLKNNTGFFSSLGLPAFLRDYLLKTFSDEYGRFNMEEVSAFVKKFIPKKEDWMSIKNKIIYENENVQILTKISVDINIKTGDIAFALPDFGVTEKETMIEPAIWELYKDDLVRGGEVWGIIKLGYRPPDETARPKIPGKIKLTGFKNFCPYTVDLEYYKDMRANFSTEEWIDVVLGAIDYNAAGFETELQKLSMLTRLLPFVEKRVNIIELAPKGTGKSYVFGHVSKYGMITDGGKVTRSKMFYDAVRRKPGFICGPDFVAIDEVKLVNFGDENEMRSILQGYLEYGKFNSNGYDGESDAGVVFLGNIQKENMDEYSYMLAELPTLFQETALLDRIHGFVKGWDIPRMNDSLKITGWALNSEYFCSIMHELRNDLSYRAIVEKIVDVPERSDTRDTEAIKRIATAYLKLLLPHVRSEFDVDKQEFTDYCLVPAMRMRRIIKLQQGMIDTEYKGKDVPLLTVKD